MPPPSRLTNASETAFPQGFSPLLGREARFPGSVRFGRVARSSGAAKGAGAWPRATDQAFRHRQGSILPSVGPILDCATHPLPPIRCHPSENRLPRPLATPELDECSVIDDTVSFFTGSSALLGRRGLVHGSVHFGGADETLSQPNRLPRASACLYSRRAGCPNHRTVSARARLPACAAAEGFLRSAHFSREKA